MPYSAVDPTLLILAAVVLAFGALGAYLVLAGWRERHSPRWLRGISACSGCLLLGFAGAAALLILGEMIWHRHPRESLSRVVCITNLNQVGRAMLMYAGDNDERTPHAQWADAYAPYAEDVWICPAEGGLYSYAFSSGLLGKPLPEQGRTIAAFDAAVGVNGVASPSEAHYRHNDSAIFLYTDGLVRTLDEGDDPTQPPDPR